jgi:hypothetical protein
MSRIALDAAAAAVVRVELGVRAHTAAELERRRAAALPADTVRALAARAGDPATTAVQRVCRRVHARTVAMNQRRRALTCSVHAHRTAGAAKTTPPAILGVAPHVDASARALDPWCRAVWGARALGAGRSFRAFGAAPPAVVGVGARIGADAPAARLPRLTGARPSETDLIVRAHVPAGAANDRLALQVDTSASAVDEPRPARGVAPPRVAERRQGPALDFAPTAVFRIARRIGACVAAGDRSRRARLIRGASRRTGTTARAPGATAAGVDRAARTARTAHATIATTASAETYPRAPRREHRASGAAGRLESLDAGSTASRAQRA